MLLTLTYVCGRNVKRFLSMRSISQNTPSLNMSESDNIQKCVRIVFISDTHSKHCGLGELPWGDVLIHAGDFTDKRPPRVEEYKDFVDWFSAQPHRHKILISGNRDSLMDTETIMKHNIKSSFWMKQIQAYVKDEQRIKYLEDELYQIPMSDKKTLGIYGTPWTALYGKPGKGFQIARTELAAKWTKIPSGVDILVTHMPPHGVLDQNSGKVRAGCPDLAATVMTRIRPRIHVFGHIHESSGVSKIGGTLFINAASKIPKSKLLNKPIIVDYSIENTRCEVKVKS